MSQFIHHRANILGISSLGIKDRPGVVDNDGHLPGGKKGRGGKRSSGFSVPAPVALESRVGK